MTGTAKEAIWLKRLLSDFPLKTDVSTGMPVRADSQSAKKMAKNESINRRNKHIDIAYHYIREVTSNGEVVLSYVPTSEMIADMLTKPLRRILFQKFRRMAGIHVKGEL